jgi:hypothetical protein
MGYVDDILDEFDKQLSIQDIYHMTYKELEYLRKHRRELMKRKHPAGKELEKALGQT